MQQLKFERNIESISVQADEVAVSIVCGWTLLIPKNKAIEYVEKYDTDCNAGFFEHDGNTILSHNAGKITFTKKESDAIVSLIKTTYLGYNRRF